VTTSAPVARCVRSRASIQVGSGTSSSSTKAIQSDESAAASAALRACGMPTRFSSVYEIGQRSFVRASSTTSRADSSGSLSTTTIRIAGGRSPNVCASSAPSSANSPAGRR